MDRALCHIHDTSHQIEWLVELKALLGGLGSTDALVGVGSSLVAVAADSNPVAVAVDSNPVAVAVDSNPVAVVEAVAVVVQVETAAFGLGQRGEEGPLLYQPQVKT